MFGSFVLFVCIKCTVRELSFLFVFCLTRLTIVACHELTVDDSVFVTFRMSS